MPARLHALIPAAGSGIRIGPDVPKQYHPIAGRAMLYHAIAALARERAIADVFVVLSAGDERYAGCGADEFGDKVVPLFCGGQRRRDSVYNGLVAMAGAVDEDDWVLVHDAARPLLPADALERLIREAGADAVGGLLAMPVADTIKRAQGDIVGVTGGAAMRVAGTEPRAALWQAQTPQMFRYGMLLSALRNADAAGVTDESSAIEQLGLAPLLVSGSAANFKVTWPEDIVMAEALLATRRAAS